LPQHDIDVIGHGFGDRVARAAMLEKLAGKPVDVLLVALGNPAQERFIASEVNAAHAQLAIGVGALFDFLAGEVPRAPSFIRRLRLEWTFRLMIEPRRLFKRYVLGNPAFLYRILRQKWRRAAPG
jgi:exopolysaccharide biosynthesis WecB/TagA/CpsF family protein